MRHLGLDDCVEGLYQSPGQPEGVALIELRESRMSVLLAT